MPAAGLAGALAVFGLWEALVAAGPTRLAASLVAALAPLRRAGREGREPAPAERRRLAVLGAATLLAAGWLLAGPPAGFALAACGPAAVAGLVRARLRRHRADVGRAAPALARHARRPPGRRSGPARAPCSSSRAAPAAPPGWSCARLAAELQADARTDDALEGLRRRAARPEVDALVAAILLHREAGGDLPAALRGVAAAHEETARLEADARAATAQARLTGTLVCGLPLGAALLAELARPGALAGLLGAPLSGPLLLAAGALQLGALVAIRRLARPAR